MMPSGEIKLAEVHRMMDRDFASVGHLTPSTVEYVEKAGFAEELGVFPGKGPFRYE